MRTIIFSVPPIPLFLLQSMVTVFEDANQSDSEIIDLREKCMNGFLSICSNLWLAPNRKLSNTSDSDPPTKVKGLRKFV